MKFLRRTWKRYPKLGKGRKKKQVWRRPTGRDNKMREKRRGYPAIVSVGHRTAEKEQERITTIFTKEDFNKIQKGNKVIFGKIGDKKKLELAKIAKEKKIEISNLNIVKFLERMEKKNKKKQEEKKVPTKETKKEEKKENTEEKR